MKNFFAGLLSLCFCFTACFPFDYFSDEDEKIPEPPKELVPDTFTVSVDKGILKSSDICTLSIRGKLSADFCHAEIRVALSEQGGKDSSPVPFNLIDDGHDFTYSKNGFVNEVGKEEFAGIERTCAITVYDAGNYFVAVKITAQTNRENCYCSPYWVTFPLLVSE